MKGSDNSKNSTPPQNDTPAGTAAPSREESAASYWKTQASDFECIMKYMSSKTTQESREFAELCDRAAVWNLLECEKEFFKNPRKVREYVEAEIRTRKISEENERSSLAAAAESWQQAQAKADEAYDLENGLCAEIAAFEELLNTASSLFEKADGEEMPALASYETAWHTLAERRAAQAEQRKILACKLLELEESRVREAGKELKEVRDNIKELKKLLSRRQENPGS